MGNLNYFFVETQDDGEDLIGEYKSAATELDTVCLPQSGSAGTNRMTDSTDPKNVDGCWYLFRRNPRAVESILEVRVAVVGNVDAGKSTILGVLTSGRLDDGRGKARQGLLRHKHELDSGRTSSIGQEILAFNNQGQAISQGHSMSGSSSSCGSLRRAGWDEICPDAHKVVTFLDLAGHEKYLKTTVFGLTGGAPDYVMLIVGANAGLIGMAKEHMALAFALSTPLMLVVTKIDMAPDNILDGTIRQLQRVLKSPSCRRAPVLIKNMEDVMLSVQNFVSQRLCPIFQVSSVSGEGIDLLKTFLHLLPIGARYGRTTDPAEFQITDCYGVPGVGTVVAGTMISGTIALGQTLYLGPDSTGAFTPCQIKGVQRKRINVPQVHAGHCASFALKKIKRPQLRKGMMLLSKELALQPSTQAKVCSEFEAEVVVLFHSTTIGKNYQAMLHCGVIRQSVSMVSMQEDLLRTGDRASVRFRFMRHPEFLKVGARLVFREGRTKGVGRVTALY